MVLRVLKLETEDQDYILELMDHTDDKKKGDADVEDYQRPLGSGAVVRGSGQEVGGHP